MATRSSWDHLRILDRKAAGLARSVGALRLVLGEALAAIDRRGAHHTLGFSSVNAYALERCGRGGTWARDAIRFARGLAGWPRMRDAVIAGRVTWSSLGLLLRALGPYQRARAALTKESLHEIEQAWIHSAERMTVRQLRAAVRDAEDDLKSALSGAVASSGVSATTHIVSPGSERGSGTCAAINATDGRFSAGEVWFSDGAVRAVHPFLRRLPTHVLTLTVSADVAWWFHCARSVYERSVSDCAASVRATESFVLALLAEARTELEGLALLDEAGVERWGNYVQMLEGWRDESEERCDAQRPRLLEVHVSPAEREWLGVGARCAEGVTDEPAVSALDREVRRLAVALNQRDLELGRLAEWLQKAEAWRRLGFSSEAHYVKERMGLSYSQWKIKRLVARKLSRLPRLQSAVEAGDVGFEAVALVLRVVTDERSERKWAERAQARTVKHLREEVRAAELGAQQCGARALPPAEETMRRLHALEGKVKSGAVLVEGKGLGAEHTAEACGCAGAELAKSRMSVAGRAWLSLRDDLAEIFGAAEPDGRWRDGSPPRRRARKGQVRFRLRLERDTLLEFRALERLYYSQHSGNFFEFLCRHFLAVWAPGMLTDVKYAHIYRRDAFTCSSPVCFRHDVQPHHLTFRSAGGGEEAENLTSLCTWCHLEGVHGGRLRVRPPASAMHWRIGAVNAFEVQGRRRVFDHEPGGVARVGVAVGGSGYAEFFRYQS